jgi:hypothetical protein
MSTSWEPSRNDPLPPALARHLERWRADAVRFADQVEAHNSAVDVARGVYCAWQRVAYFTGREADREGREASAEEAAEYYVDLLMELGRALCDIGFADRVRGLEAGEDPTRATAVELLRFAVAGDRPAVAYLDGAMRAAAFVGGGAAAAYLKNELRYEVLNVRPPVPVPPGWEGLLPDEEVRAPQHFITWVDRRLEFLHLSLGRPDERSTGADVRNAHRLLAHLDIPHDYPFPHGGMTNGEEEVHLRNLRNVCLTAAQDARTATGHAGEQEPHIPTNPSVKPVDGPVEPFRFRWSGVEREFLKDERRYHRLLVAVWPTFRLRTSTHIEDANKRLEDLGGSALEPKSMQNYARELSQILTERFRFPSRLELDGDYLMWRDLPDTTASP